MWGTVQTSELDKWPLFESRIYRLSWEHWTFLHILKIYTAIFIEQLKTRTHRDRRPTCAFSWVITMSCTTQKHNVSRTTSCDLTLFCCRTLSPISTSQGLQSWSSIFITLKNRLFQQYLVSVCCFFKPTLCSPTVKQTFCFNYLHKVIKKTALHVMMRSRKLCCWSDI